MAEAAILRAPGPAGTVEHMFAGLDDEFCVCQTCGRRYRYDYRKGHTRKRCNSCRSNVARFLERSKAQLVALLGGRCELCGYRECLRALAFHCRGWEAPNGVSVGLQGGLSSDDPRTLSVVMSSWDMFAERDGLPVRRRDASPPRPIRFSTDCTLRCGNVDYSISAKCGLFVSGEPCTLPEVL
jgi:hypothetical protein